MARFNMITVLVISSNLTLFFSAKRAVQYVITVMFLDGINSSYTLTLLYWYVLVSKVTDRGLHGTVYRLPVWRGFWSSQPYQKWSGDNTAFSLLETGGSSPEIKWSVCEADFHFETRLSVPWLYIDKTPSRSGSKFTLLYSRDCCWPAQLA
jgi:hypothetical protein